MRNTSMVTTPFTSSARYGTPQRVGGRVAAVKSGLAIRPCGSSDMSAPLPGRKEASDPSDDGCCCKHQSDSDDHADRPAPGDAPRSGGDAECHDENDGDRGCDRDQCLLQVGGPG